MSYLGAEAMETIRLSTKGQLVIPKAVRQAHGWSDGQELEVIDTPAGVLIRTPSPFAATALADAAGCLKAHYQGPAVSLEEMTAAVDRALKDSFR